MTIHTIRWDSGDTDTILSPEFVAAYQTPRRSNMKFLIDTFEGETIIGEFSTAWTSDLLQSDVIYVNGLPCRHSTARSLEAEALKEAKVLLWELRSYALRQRPMPEDLRDRISVILDNRE